MFSVDCRRELGYAPPSMSLTAKQKQYLKGLAHGLEPVVQVGSKGISDGLIDQIRDQLVRHELIKVRFNTESAIEPAECAEELATRTKSELVQKMGRMLVFYRRHDEKPKIELPKGKRPRASVPSPSD
jgi:RNA-binding protein